ncbi:MerR family transcriptional regulator [bacterium]|nr:MerR family transcriptional regulator [bacterium]
MAGPEIRRLYYSTKEVSELVQVPPYALRIWEIKFPHLRPSKSKSGRRLYKQKDLDAVFMIKKLKDQGYPDDAIFRLTSSLQVDKINGNQFISQKRIEMVLFLEMKDGLKEILNILDGT